MLPPSHQLPYQTLHQQVQALQAQLSQAAPPALAQAIRALQSVFREQVLPQSLDDLPSDVAQRAQSIQVEMNKQLQLLGVDGTFLQAARQPATMAQRQQQVRDRLDRLTRYCEMVLGTDEPAD